MFKTEIKVDGKTVETTQSLSLRTQVQKASEFAKRIGATTHDNIEITIKQVGE